MIHIQTTLPLVDERLIADAMVENRLLHGDTVSQALGYALRQLPAKVFSYGDMHTFAALWRLAFYAMAGEHLEDLMVEIP